METGKTTAYTNEPSGLSFDPGSGHLFVSDDDLFKIFEVAPGGDAQFGTTDDSVVASFGTKAYGNNDPEDVAFDTDTGDLYVSDGIGQRCSESRVATTACSTASRRPATTSPPTSTWPGSAGRTRRVSRTTPADTPSWSWIAARM
jgi:hypothetical protein